MLNNPQFSFIIHHSIVTMIYCPKCHTQLVENAKFCHQCGNNIDIPLTECPSCQKKNPADVPFCYGCAHPMQIMELSMPTYQSVKSRYQFDNITGLEDQIKSLFFEELKRLANTIAPKRIDDYLMSFYTKGFAQTVDLRAKQLAESSAEMSQKNIPVLKLEKDLEMAVNSLALYHILYNCKDINPFPIPEKILRYEKIHRGSVDLRQMIMDYLNFETEKERVFTDFVSMPTETMQNAAKNFLYPAKGEFIYFISDQTVSANGKEGFGMTEFAIYWKAPLDKPQKIYYHHLARLETHKDWIKINTRFFNVSPSLNIKMLLLLEKLKDIYAI